MRPAPTRNGFSRLPLLAESHAEQMDLLSPIFPAFAKFMKNPEFCPDREKAFLDSLQALESHLAKQLPHYACMHA